MDVDTARRVGTFKLLPVQVPERVLFQDNLPDSLGHRFGIVVLDIAVLLRLRKEKTFQDGPGDGKLGHVLEGIQVPPFLKLVVDHFTDECGADGGIVPGEGPVLHGLRDASRFVIGKGRLFHQGFNDARLVPRIGDVLRRRFNEKEGVG